MCRRRELCRSSRDDFGLFQDQCGGGGFHVGRVAVTQQQPFDGGAPLRPDLLFDVPVGFESVRNCGRQPSGCSHSTGMVCGRLDVTSALGLRSYLPRFLTLSYKAPQDRCRPGCAGDRQYARLGTQLDQRGSALAT